MRWTFSPREFKPLLMQSHYFVVCNGSSLTLNLILEVSGRSPHQAPVVNQGNKHLNLFF